jgi:hypothetical protein
MPLSTGCEAALTRQQTDGTSRYVRKANQVFRSSRIAVSEQTTGS